MEKINDGGPAFPITEANGANNGMPGMSLRDFFAAKAMTSLIEGYEFEAREKSVKKTERTGFDDNPHDDSDSTYASQMAEEAYIIADAMLAQRTK